MFYNNIYSGDLINIEKLNLSNKLKELISDIALRFLSHFNKLCEISTSIVIVSMYLQLANCKH